MTLAERIERLDQHGGIMRFSQCTFAGRKAWITTCSIETMQTLCEVYNRRNEIAAALRARAKGE